MKYKRNEYIKTLVGLFQQKYDYLFLYDQKKIFFSLFHFQNGTIQLSATRIAWRFFPKQKHQHNSYSPQKNHKWIFQEQNGSRPAMRKLSLLFYLVLLHYSPPFGAVLRGKCGIWFKFVVCALILAAQQCIQKPGELMAETNFQF